MKTVRWNVCLCSERAVASFFAKLIHKGQWFTAEVTPLPDDDYKIALEVKPGLGEDLRELARRS